MSMSLEFTKKSCDRAALAYQAPGLLAYRDACSRGVFSRLARNRLEQSITKFCLEVLHAWRDRAPEA
jgi:hypothetical protein